jgi:hypothetical protein
MTKLFVIIFWVIGAIGFGACLKIILMDSELQQCQARHQKVCPPLTGCEIEKSAPGVFTIRTIPCQQVCAEYGD